MKHHKPSDFHEDDSPTTVFAAPMADAFGKGASMFGRSFAAMQKEGLRFFNQRMEENAKAVEHFAACKSLPDVFAAQQKWFADMTRAYTEGWQRCGEVMTEVMRENTEEIEAEARKQVRPDQAH